MQQRPLLVGRSPATATAITALPGRRSSSSRVVHRASCCDPGRRQRSSRTEAVPTARSVLWRSCRMHGGGCAPGLMAAWQPRQRQQLRMVLPAMMGMGKLAIRRRAFGSLRSARRLRQARKLQSQSRCVPGCRALQGSAAGFENSSRPHTMSGVWSARISLTLSWHGVVSTELAGVDTCKRACHCPHGRYHLRHTSQCTQQLLQRSRQLSEMRLQPWVSSSCKGLTAGKNGRWRK